MWNLTVCRHTVDSTKVLACLQFHLSGMYNFIVMAVFMIKQDGRDAY